MISRWDALLLLVDAVLIGLWLLAKEPVTWVIVTLLLLAYY